MREAHRGKAVDRIRVQRASKRAGRDPRTTAYRAARPSGLPETSPRPRRKASARPHGKCRLRLGLGPETAPPSRPPGRRGRTRQDAGKRRTGDPATDHDDVIRPRRRHPSLTLHRPPAPREPTPFARDTKSRPGDGVWTSDFGLGARAAEVFEHEWDDPLNVGEGREVIGVTYDLHGNAEGPASRAPGPPGSPPPPSKGALGALIRPRSTTYDERLDARSAAPMARGSHSSISSRSRSETSPNASQKASQSPRHKRLRRRGTSAPGDGP